jgi:hypothetical protein
MKKKILKINIFLVSAFIIFLIAGTSVNIGNSEKYDGDESNIIPKPSITYDWYNFTLPSEPIPTTNINFTRDGSTVSFTLEHIIDYAKYDNGTFQLINYTIEKDGSYYEIVGFNPMDLMEIAEWYDVMNFTVNARDGYSKHVNITQLLLADGNETIIIIAWNDQWLADYDVDYGDFYLWGENLASNQMVKNISSISYDDPWTVNFIVNGTNEAILNSNNATTSVTGNYTSYDWGYIDNYLGKSWDQRECTGFTVASLLQHTSIGDQNYTISFVAYDGYGATKIFTKEEIEQGFTGFTIDDPPVELSNQGKQAMLMEISDGEPIRYSRGPYQLVAPGADKANYIGGIVEVRITIIPNLNGSNNIPGFQIPLLVIASISVISVLILKNKKN